jgi:LmbE family N-acetylglucosaminyl deacetylase
VPEELTSTVSMLAFPDIPQVPAPMRGRYVASIRIAYSGLAEEGERLVAPLRALGERLKDDLRAMPYTESHTIHSDPDHPHAYAATNALLGEFTEETAAALLEVAGPASGAGAVVDVRHLGGALARAGGAGIAVDHREAAYIVRIITGPEGAAARAGIRAALTPWTLGHSLNFLYGAGADADEAQTRAGYRPDTYARLAALKARHDPRNLFRFNRNIRPHAG